MVQKKKSSKTKPQSKDNGQSHLLKVINDQFSGVNRQLRRFDIKFQNIDKRFERVDIQFQNINERFERVDVQFQSVDKRFAEVISSVASLFEDYHEKTTNQFRETRVLMEQIERRVTETMLPLQMLINNDEKIKNHGGRIEKLETEVQLLKTVDQTR